jgi:hypothetical protein
LLLLGKGTMLQYAVGSLSALGSAVVFDSFRPYLHNENNTLATYSMAQVPPHNPEAARGFVCRTKS